MEAEGDGVITTWQGRGDPRTLVQPSNQGTAGQGMNSGF